MVTSSACIWARAAARSITSSPIWQCALAGGDPNWGRIWSSLGQSSATIEPAKLAIAIGDVQIVEQGVSTKYDQAAAKQAMAGKEVTITVDLNVGSAEATAWGCDLTEAYVVENSAYST